MKNLLNKIIFGINILVSAGLLAAYLGTHISPANFWPLAFFGLIFPYLLILNFIFLLYWVILWKSRALVPLVVILLGINHIHYSFPVIRLRGKVNAEPEAGDLRILSYNVRAFNLYEWLNDPNTNKGIFNFIRSEHPDVICLQEFYSGEIDQASINYIRLFGEHPYKHVEYVSREKNSGHGIATFSKYPIIRKGEIPFRNSNNMTIFTDILFNGDTVRIYNNHLQSVRFRENNYRLLETIGKRKNHPEMDEIRDLSSKLKTAYIKRAEQTDLVKAHARNSEYPLIICGDFNDTPVSYTYNKLRKDLKDAFLEAGKGRGNTYLGRLSFRIDYILYSDNFKAIDFEKVEANLSDHYPIISVLRLKD